MDKKSKNTLIVSIIALALVLVGVTYAYFSARITGLESASTLRLTAGRMAIVYSEGDETVSISNIYPREEAWLTKTFTFTGWNTTDQKMSYNIYLNVINNTFPNTYLTYDLRVLESTNGTPVAQKIAVPINGVGSRIIGKGTFTNADGDVHRYELKIYFKDNGKDQNDAQGAIFNGKISVNENRLVVNDCIAYETPIIDYDINYSNCESFISGWGFSNNDVQTYCSGGVITYGEELTESLADDLNNQYMRDDLISAGVIENIVYGEPEVAILNDGFSYSNGQYIYYFMGSMNGWLMDLLDNESTDPITTKMCTSINGYPIVSMASLFHNSRATSIDLSSFDTSNVIYMNGMFLGSSATSLDLSSFDTSNVTYMDRMFSYSNVTSLDLSSFDTSNVTDMYGMFMGSAAMSIDLSSFNTSNATNMEGMFQDCQARDLNLSSFDTSKVTNMEAMFLGCQARDLNLSSFDTSNVTNMNSMFQGCQVRVLDLSSFDTSNVTLMQYMFGSRTLWDQTTSSDIVINPAVETIYVSDKFVTSAVTYSSRMFYGATSLVGGNGTHYNSSYVDKTYACIDGKDGLPGYFTQKTN